MYGAPGMPEGALWAGGGLNQRPNHAGGLAAESPQRKPELAMHTAKAWNTAKKKLSVSWRSTRPVSDALSIMWWSPPGKNDSGLATGAKDAKPTRAIVHGSATANTR